MDQIGRLLSDAALQFPDRVAIRTRDGLVRTYADFDERSTRLANALLDSGFTPGDRVAAWLGTCPQYLEIYLAVAKAGLVLVAINILFTEHEAAYQLEDSGAIGMFHQETHTQQAQALAAKFHLQTLVPVGSWLDEGTAFEELVRSGSDLTPPEPDEDALYVLSYTSGTTGRPKGAMVTHRSLKNTARNHAHSYRTPQGSVVLYYANMSFVATVLGLLISHIFVRGTIVIVAPVDGPEDAMNALGEEQGTFTFVASPWLPPMTELAREHPDKWQQVRSIVHSASKASPAQLERWAEVIGHRYLEGWGMTEGSGSLFTVTDVDDVVKGSDAHDFFASVGRPCIDVVVRVVDADGRECPHDGTTIGELVVKSPALVVGYWNNEAATAKSFRDGWFHTGDLGAIDPAGYVYVTERRTDLIVSGGMNVYPSEVEYCITEMDGVAEAAVIGVPHERWGETPMVFVVRTPGSEVTEQTVIDHCTTYLARFKRPSHVTFIDELPRNASQKVLKRVLRESVDHDQ